jgi:hypothetical protein
MQWSRSNGALRCFTGSRSSGRREFGDEVASAFYAAVMGGARQWVSLNIIRRSAPHTGRDLLERKPDCHRRHTAPVRYGALFGVYRGSLGRWFDRRHSRLRRNAEPEASRPTSSGWQGLLLGACSRFRHHERSGALSLVRGLSLVRPWFFVLHRGDHRSHGEAKALVCLAAFSYDRNGRVVHSHDNGLLCRQRAEPSGLASAAADRLLDFADAHRRADLDQRAHSPPDRAATRFKLTYFSARLACHIQENAAAFHAARRASLSPPTWPDENGPPHDKFVRLAATDPR